MAKFAVSLLLGIGWVVGVIDMLRCTFKELPLFTAPSDFILNSGDCTRVANRVVKLLIFLMGQYNVGFKDMDLDASHF